MIRSLQELLVPLMNTLLLALQSVSQTDHYLMKALSRVVCFMNDSVISLITHHS